MEKALSIIGCSPHPKPVAAEFTAEPMECNAAILQSVSISNQDDAAVCLHIKLHLNDLGLKEHSTKLHFCQPFLSPPTHPGQQGRPPLTMHFLDHCKLQWQLDHQLDNHLDQKMMIGVSTSPQQQRGISRQAYRAAVQTGTEIEWHGDSCAVELSSLPGEPVAASSRLENIDSRESHLEQGSTVVKLIETTLLGRKRKVPSSCTATTTTP
ncbi:hypothetical protein P5673_033400, partial [Acropora cervicornis]